MKSKSKEPPPPAAADTKDLGPGTPELDKRRRLPPCPVMPGCPTHLPQGGQHEDYEIVKRYCTCAEKNLRRKQRLKALREEEVKFVMAIVNEKATIRPDQEAAEREKAERVNRIFENAAATNLEQAFEKTDIEFIYGVLEEAQGLKLSAVACSWWGILCGAIQGVIAAALSTSAHSVNGEIFQSAPPLSPHSGPRRAEEEHRARLQSGFEVFEVWILPNCEEFLLG